jgi:hypothetical protein
MTDVALVQWLVALPLKRKILLFIVSIIVFEVILRVFAPESKLTRAWTGFFTRVAQSRVIQFLAKFWTAIILSIIYFVSILPVSVFHKLFGKDPLDRGLDPEPSFWRKHEPNPLGPRAAARHQF